MGNRFLKENSVFLSFESGNHHKFCWQSCRAGRTVLKSSGSWRSLEKKVAL